MITRVIRPDLETAHITKSIETISTKVNARLEQKGKGIYASPHEASGIITEEYLELMEAIRTNNLFDITLELEDVAVACITAIASIVQTREVTT